MTSLIFCHIMAGFTIIGAVESQPGWVTVDYLNEKHTPDYIIIPTDAYLECYPDDAAGLTTLKE